MSINILVYISLGLLTLLALIDISVAVRNYWKIPLAWQSLRVWISLMKGLILALATGVLYAFTRDSTVMYLFGVQLGIAVIAVVVFKQRTYIDASGSEIAE